MIESLIVSALVPAAVDIIKGIGGAFSRKFIGVSVDDQVKLDQSSVSKLEALAKLDNPFGTPSQWVINLRASFRYVAAAVLIFVGCFIMLFGALSKDMNIVLMGGEVSGMPFSFIFGERMNLALQGKQK